MPKPYHSLNFRFSMTIGLKTVLIGCFISLTIIGWSWNSKPIEALVTINISATQARFFYGQVIPMLWGRAVSLPFSPPWPNSPAVMFAYREIPIQTLVHPCLAFIQIMLFELQCIILSNIAATEHLHVGWKRHGNTSRIILIILTVVKLEVSIPRPWKYTDQLCSSCCLFQRSFVCSDLTLLAHLHKKNDVRPSLWWYPLLKLILWRNKTNLLYNTHQFLTQTN